MDITDIQNEFVHFPYIRRELEAMGLVGNMILKFAADPTAPKGVQFNGRGWRMFRKSEADEYLARKRVELGLPPKTEGTK
jgi:hypothetical protein